MYRPQKIKPNDYIKEYNIANILSYLIPFAVTILGFNTIRLYLINIGFTSISLNDISFYDFINTTTVILLYYMIYPIIAIVIFLGSMIVIIKISKIKIVKHKKQHQKGIFLIGVLFSTPILFIIFYYLIIYYYPYKKIYQNIEWFSFNTLMGIYFLLIYVIYKKCIKYFNIIKKDDKSNFIFFIIYASFFGTISFMPYINKFYSLYNKSDFIILSNIIAIMLFSSFIFWHFIFYKKKFISVTYIIYFLTFLIIITSYISPKFIETIMSDVGFLDKKEKIYYIEKDFVEKTLNQDPRLDYKETTDKTEKIYKSYCGKIYFSSTTHVVFKKYDSDKFKQIPKDKIYPSQNPHFTCDDIIDPQPERS